MSVAIASSSGLPASVLRGEPASGVSTLDLAVSVAESLCKLPAVATVDWCDKAAACLTSLLPKALAVVAFVGVDQQGRVTEIIAGGVSIAGPSSELISPEQARLAEAVRCRLEGILDTPWTAAAAGQPVRGPMSTLIPGSGVRLSAHAELWRALGSPDVAAAISPLHEPWGRRCVLAYVTSLSPDSRVTGDLAAVLRSSITLLARRAAIAVGRDRAVGSWLSPREQQILEQLILGKSVKQIADDLGRSPHTVHDHVKSLHRKLNASSRGELIARALGYVERGVRIRDQHDDHAQGPAPAVVTIPTLAATPDVKPLLSSP